MATNILSMPLVQMTATTGNNEDWIDTLQYLQSSSPDLPFDLTGIALSMEVRALLADPDVVISGSSIDGRVTVGGLDTSFLLINVPMSIMKEVPPGDYVADIVAEADGYTRVVVQITQLTIFQGVTR